MHVPSSSLPTTSQSGGLRGIMQRHPLLCYFLLAYGFSWLAWLPYILSRDGLGLLPFSPGQLAIMPGAYLGPLLSGLLMTAATEGKPGMRRLFRRFIPGRVSWPWYLLAIFGVPAIIFLGLFAMPGALATLNPAFSQLALFFPLLLILEILTSGLAEEPGWRGFALPRLQQQFGPLPGTTILGLLWGCWHLPLFLTAWGNGADLLLISEFILSTVATAIVITWVFNHTRRSLLIAILMHATIDAFISSLAGASIFPAEWMQKYDNLALLSGFGLVALVLIIVTRGRLGYQQASLPSDTRPALNAGKA